jgi:hypothetical protein
MTGIATAVATHYNFAANDEASALDRAYSGNQPRLQWLVRPVRLWID